MGSMDTRSEKEKMLAGDLYYSFGDELFGERQHAKTLIHKYNNELATKVEGRAVSNDRCRTEVCCLLKCIRLDQV